MLHPDVDDPLVVGRSNGIPPISENHVVYVDRTEFCLYATIVFFPDPSGVFLYRLEELCYDSTWFRFKLDVASSEMHSERNTS